MLKNPVVECKNLPRNFTDEKTLWLWGPLLGNLFGSTNCVSAFSAE